MRRASGCRRLPRPDAGQAGEGTRTPDLPLTRRLLYQLSYSGKGDEGNAPVREGFVRARRLHG